MLKYGSVGLCLVTLRPVVEFHDDCAVGVALACKEAVTHDLLGVLHPGYLEDGSVDLVEGGAGAFLRGARRHVKHGEEVAGIFVRHKCGGGDGHQPYKYCYRGGHNAE